MTAAVFVPGTLTIDLPAVADVHDQDHEPVIIDRVQDPVVTRDPDPQDPVHPGEHLRPRRPSDCPAAIPLRP